MSEEMVVRQCAPTLAGIKAGSLFPCPCTDRDALLDEVRQQAAAAAGELAEAAHLRRGQIVVVGCSTSLSVAPGLG